MKKQELIFRKNNQGVNAKERQNLDMKSVHQFHHPMYFLNSFLRK